MNIVPIATNAIFPINMRLNEIELNKNTFLDRENIPL